MIANEIAISASGLSSLKNSPIQARAMACIAGATIMGRRGLTLSNHRLADGWTTMELTVVITMT
ncbi:hypothetical protein DIJ64_11905 [Mycobacterium leprae]|uniref:Uncharacterized protein n=1 Tax=Mycobacterium leprae TaxID=1769 RepID=A0AAD0KTL2_MYCLR|nr:hypothetical protein [Mycobacterium leprae]AWV48507.1 hypothetical protein DIJ64_11905 [Mycobacterium leprae]OAR19986.1 hypothetical protein A8144_03245 [Mycobacterium leprae 3125609]OAX70936.1 hypothetical protein A3216_08875 [Mycobacterium leprae 7935681]